MNHSTALGARYSSIFRSIAARGTAGVTPGDRILIAETARLAATGSEPHQELIRRLSVAHFTFCYNQPDAPDHS